MLFPRVRDCVVGVLACAVAFGSTPAQNILRNGAFEDPTLTHWAIFGWALNATLEYYRTNGVASSRAYAVQTGGINVNGGATGIEQTFLASMGQSYEATVDFALYFPVAHTGALGVRLSHGSLSQGYQLIDQKNYSSGAAGEVLRGRLHGRFNRGVTGSIELRVQFDGAYQAIWATTPRGYLDNADLRLARDPSFALTGSRRIGMLTSYLLEGVPSAPYFVFVAGGRGAPISLPPFTGTLELDVASMFLILSGAMGTQGQATGAIFIPNDMALVGLPLHWQAAQFSVTPSVATIGWPSLQTFFL